MQHVVGHGGKFGLFGNDPPDDEHAVAKDNNLRIKVRSSAGRNKSKVTVLVHTSFGDGLLDRGGQAALGLFGNFGSLGAVNRFRDAFGANVVCFLPLRQRKAV